MRKARTGTAHGQLMFGPRDNCLDFLSRQYWKDEMGIQRLPCLRFGFVQGEAQCPLVAFEGVARFGKDRLFRPFDLREDLLARRDAGVPESRAR